MESKQPVRLPLMWNMLACSGMALGGLGFVLALEAFTPYDLGEAGWGLAGAIIGGIVGNGTAVLQLYQKKE